MDIRIRLVKVGAGAPDYSCLGHAQGGMAVWAVCYRVECATVGCVWRNGAADALASASVSLLQREILSQTPVALWMTGRFPAIGAIPRVGIAGLPWR
jgi:hypothetical protein